MMQKCGHLEPFEPPATNPFCLSVAQKEYFIIIYKSFSSVLPGASCNLYGLCVCVCVFCLARSPKNFPFFRISKKITGVCVFVLMIFLYVRVYASGC